MKKFKFLLLFCFFSIVVFSSDSLYAADKSVAQPNTAIENKTPKPSENNKATWYNTPLAGVLLASTFALLTGIFNHTFSLVQEKKKWEREQASKTIEKNETEKRDKKAQVKAIYENCISKLSQIEACKDQENSITDDDFKEIYHDALNYLSQLAIHQRDIYAPDDYNFHKQFNEFLSNPKFFADSILQEVYRLAMEDKILFPDKQLVKKSNDTTRIQINYSEDYRKEKFIEKSLILPKTTSFPMEIKKISPAQRAILWEQYTGLPKRIYLSIPKISDGTKKNVNLKGEIWALSGLNLEEHNEQAVFDKWEQDYNLALKEGKKQIKS